MNLSEILYRQDALYISQGALTAAQGGKFQHGFFSAALSAGLAPGIMDKINTKGGRVLASSVVGGTASAIGGGKFANGAITGAYVMLFNEMKHPKVEEIGDDKLKEIYDAYPKRSEKSADEVYEQVGGPLKDWYDTNPEALGNTCAIRLSVALNESGNPIPAVSGTYKGKDNKNYFISVKNMSKYLTNTFGQPTTLQSGQSIGNGIIWQSNCGWSDATGHLDIIYNGKAGSYYYDVCGTVKYWR